MLLGSRRPYLAQLGCKAPTRCWELVAEPERCSGEECRAQIGPAEHLERLRRRR